MLEFCLQLRVFELPSAKKKYVYIFFEISSKLTMDTGKSAQSKHFFFIFYFIKRYVKGLALEAYGLKLSLES